MNAVQFIDLISKTEAPNRSDLVSLEKIQENFPYFQIPYILTSRYQLHKFPDRTPDALSMAAITSPNRIWLKKLVEKEYEETKSPSDLSNDQEEKAARPERRRRKSPNDDLIATIKKKEKKAILDSKKREQMDLIKAFSKKDIKLATIKEIEANQNTENLAASSTEINDELLSESFAKLLVSQGKKPKAKKIYEKLMLKFPEKSSYFADLIEKLKE